MKKFTFFLVIFLSAISCSKVIAGGVNDLKVQNPFTSKVRAGYINRATLVVEPHGGYVEQSLYIEYSDRNQFSYGERIEVVHKFELPKGALVNDLWLWIGNNVVQARILDTWHAKKIYDGVVTSYRDPAYLSKKGDQYELHVFPMSTGVIRKVKLNFISPTQWIGNQATAELPIKFLNSNNSTVKPVDILFRTKEEMWGKPSIMEYVYQGYEKLKDTLNYQYKRFTIANTGANSTLTLLFQTDFSSGYFYENNEVSKGLTYYQLGILPSKFFEAQVDTAKHKVIVGIDLSGKTKKTYEQIFTNVKNVLKSSLRSTDKFNIILSGAGMVKKISDIEYYATAENIDSMLARTYRNPIMDSLRKYGNILFCDKSALASWSFPSINNIAVVTSVPNISTAENSFYKADAVAAYEYGYEYPLTEYQTYLIKQRVDSLFNRGGRFLTYFDSNRSGLEKIATSYITGLRTISKDTAYNILFRNSAGNIGNSFPEKIVRKNTYYLTSDDPDVKVELMDSYGRAAVISKKIGSGIIVVSGMWSYNDEALLKTDENIPLLGLNTIVKNAQVFNLLNEMKNYYSASSFDKGLIFSNSDTLIQKNDAINWITAYLNKYPASAVNFSTINVMDTLLSSGTITEDLTEYYGTGYFWKTLAGNSNGFNFETHATDWTIIANTLNSFTAPRLMGHTFTITVDNGAGQSFDQVEINPNATDPQRPLFHVGSTNGHNELKFNITAKFSGSDAVKSITLPLPVNHDSTKAEKIIPAILAQEKLKILFTQPLPLDTAKILDISITERVLSDFTAFLALEPNDTIKFMPNPFDESGLFTGVKKDDMTYKDSLDINAYPNPFNGQTSIIVNLKEASHITLAIYNILGQMVKEFPASENASGKQTYYWNGRNSNNETISSGIYFVRANVKSNVTQRSGIYSRKLILMK